MSSAITSFISLNLVTHHKSHSLERNKRSVSCNKRSVSWISAAKHGYSFGIYSLRKAKHITRMDMNAINNLPPLPPPPPSGSPLPGWSSWMLFTIIPMLIPIFTGKWGPLIELKRRMNTTLQRVQNLAETIEDVAEIVDNVADEVTEKLPEDSRLREIIEKIDDIAEETIRTADCVEDLLQKVEDAGEKVDTILKETAKERKDKEEVGVVAKEVSAKKVLEGK